ncbi:MAG: succinylglutamate desuccinylase/aspartoacylase family protein [Bdellovibrionales bacterium]|nr:succinylglutamate desuccinylase/aspartoacylase family protein [Bdellovibrionales bacterium]
MTRTQKLALVGFLACLMLQGCKSEESKQDSAQTSNQIEIDSTPKAGKDEDLFKKHGDKLKEKIEGKDSSEQQPKPSEDGATWSKRPKGLLQSRKFSEDELKEACLEKMASFPGKYDKALLADVCSDLQILPSCVSRNGQPIYHYNRPSRRKDGAERILTFAVTHGDEIASGAVARSWANRLSRISPRNEWRIVPVLNPDGYDKKTRTNAAGVDVNRNYPSKDWDEFALKWWKEKKKEDPRRYPGPKAASEPETICSMDHIEEFKPDMIISIHTPLGLLDFDGPKVNFPQFSKLPWISLGTYPGSLGRYMWHDNKVPVLTIELKSNVDQALEKFDKLQDISGQVALTVSKTSKSGEDKKAAN